MNKLKLKILNELKKGSSTNTLFEIAVMNGYTGSRKNFKDYIRRLRDKYNITKNTITNIPRVTNEHDMIDSLHEFLSSNGPTKLIDICRTFKCSPDLVDEKIKSLRSTGIEIVCDDYIVYLSKIASCNTAEKITTPLEDKSIIFGVASDLHIGSKAVQLTALNEFCEICRKRGVKHIFVPGDIFSGIDVYKGHQYEVYALSAEDQINSAINNLPRGFQWYMMGGNHDASFTAKGGVNPLAVLAAKRSDVHYVGYDEVDIPILKDVDLKMIHPSGGGNYASSYKLQKSLEKIAFGELRNNIIDSGERNNKIRFMLAGHLHIQMQGMFGSIFGAQCGCFEGETSYMKRKGLMPQVGGYIIDANIGNDSFLKDFDARFYLYKEILEDWKNFTHSANLSEPDEIDPIFDTTDIIV